MRETGWLASFMGAVWRERQREGGREREKERGRERKREGGKEGESEGEREREREEGSLKLFYCILACIGNDIHDLTCATHN